MDLTLSPVAYVRSPFAGKFGAPRQPGLVTEATGTVEFLPGFDREEMVRGLGDFSHLWLIFGFHLIEEKTWHPTVRPPRLGGNERVGVWASRSPFRPSPLGLSLVALRKVRIENHRASLEISGLDLVDRTPVYDVKPYLPWCEAEPDATAGWAAESASALDLPVLWLPEARALLEKILVSSPNFQLLVEQTLLADPRPAYHGSSQQQTARSYGVALGGWNIRWQVEETRLVVSALEPAVDA